MRQVSIIEQIVNIFDDLSYWGLWVGSLSEDTCDKLSWLWCIEVGDVEIATKGLDYCDVIWAQKWVVENLFLPIPIKSVLSYLLCSKVWPYSLKILAK